MGQQELMKRNLIPLKPLKDDAWREVAQKSLQYHYIQCFVLTSVYTH